MSDEVDVKVEKQTEQVSLELPASYNYLTMLDACVAGVLKNVEDLPDRETLVYNIHLALHETYTNIVEHAYGDQSGRIKIAILLERAPRSLIIIIKDRGKSFDPDNIAKPDLNAPQIRGYGLFLVHQLMDDVQYSTQSGENIWRLTKQI